MLAPVVWLRPSARDLLRSTSTLLRGEVPCPAAKLAGLLEDGNAASQCDGLLGDAGIRAAFAKKLKSKEAPKDISDKNAAALVDLLAATLKEKLDDIKSKAKAISQKLPNGTIQFGDLQKLLGEAPGSALKQDWVQWHAPGSTHDSKALPALTPAVLKERISILAACGEEGHVSNSAIAFHVLENLETYLAWELMIPGSKPPATGQEVTAPFDKKLSQEVAIRRVLSRILPLDAANDAATAATDAKNLRGTLEKMTTAARTGVVIPMYCAPPAPPEPKQPKEKGEKGDKAEKGKDAKKGGKNSASDTPLKVPGGSMEAHRAATATQELQWHLLRYRMMPRTTLSDANPAPASKAPAMANGTSAVGGGMAAAGEVGRPQGFAGIWSPGADMPPGHTPFSWQHAKAAGMGEGFATTWSDNTAPPGHTEHSWKKAFAYGSASPSAPSGKKAPKAAKQETAPAAKGGASNDGGKKNKTPAPAAAAQTGAAPAEGTPEAALCKLDIRSGRIIKVEKVPNSDKLYLLQVNIGDEQPRQVVSGLQKHYKESDLENRAVIVYCNIKPGKLAGCESQAMILAATKDKDSPNEVCELLAPPSGVPEGTRPRVGDLEVGSASAGVSVKNISKVWGVVQPLLRSSNKREAVFSGTPLLMNGSPVSTGNLTDTIIS
eukprot:TRINITY_DN1711_c0_g7_i1.p1 TRINITY_DN1711_c0_g7~~TRINITY_DN1711_c0_g7_i1.p1  ORF type:complete len:685 (-),score=140.22 TRINITY_DN1711_c0_g7_i1:103-2091(-)